MRILLVRPRPDPETIGLQHVMLVEPLELETLAAAAPRRDSCVIADLIIETEPLEHFLRRHRPQVLCVTGYITNVPAMLDYCRRAKAYDPSIVTVVGGVHCEVCPEDLDHPAVDHRVVRNGVIAFPALLDLIRGSRGAGDHPALAGVFGPGEGVDKERLPPFDWSYPIPDRSLTQKHRHRYFYIFHDHVALLKTAFGCPYQCNFCFCRLITDGAFKQRPLEDVIEELAGIEERDIYIVDDDFMVSRNRVRAFIDAVRARELDKRYLLYARSDFIANNPDLVEEFKEVGLATVIVGFESFDDAELDRYDKGTDTATNAAAMTLLNRLRIDCYATIILDPAWGSQEFAALDRKLKELKIHYVNLQPLTPLPATATSISDDQLVIPREDYVRWDLAHVTVQPSKLSVAEYYQHMIDGYSKVLYQPRVLLGYLKYPPASLWRMISGNSKVFRQYVGKMKEARRLGQ